MFELWFWRREKIDYAQLSKEGQVKRISKFTSAIWQVHPFIEGNTRTTALFLIKYLKKLGFKLNEDIFIENSLYFRNTLVISNFFDITLGIFPDFKYLHSFFSKLLINKTQELINLEEFKEKINKKINDWENEINNKDKQWER